MTPYDSGFQRLAFAILIAIVFILVLLTGCSYVYKIPTNGEWAGGERLDQDRAECHQSAENYIADIGYGRGFNGQRFADAHMHRCMTQRGYTWVKTEKPT